MSEEEKKFMHNIQIQQQPDGGYLVKWRALETGRTEHSQAVENKLKVMEIVDKLLSE